jgi:hypothetical protein
MGYYYRHKGKGNYYIVYGLPSGELKHEPVGSNSSKRLLAARMVEVGKGREPINLRAFSFKDMFEAVLADYRANAHKTSKVGAS